MLGAALAPHQGPLLSSSPLSGLEETPSPLGWVVGARPGPAQGGPIACHEYSRSPSPGPKGCVPRNWLEFGQTPARWPLAEAYLERWVEGASSHRSPWRSGKARSQRQLPAVLGTNWLVCGLPLILSTSRAQRALRDSAGIHCTSYQEAGNMGLPENTIPGVKAQETLILRMGCFRPVTRQYPLGVNE